MLLYTNILNIVMEVMSPFHRTCMYSTLYGHVTGQHCKVNYLPAKMVSLLALSITLVLFTAHHGINVAADDCQDMAAKGICSFYPQCVESRFPCGPNGYALGYGNKYCKIFVNDANCYTSDVSSRSLP